MARSRMVKGEVKRVFFPKGYGWINSLTTGVYASRSEAELAYRLENAQALDLELYQQCYADVIETFDKVYECPTCKQLLTGFHEKACESFKCLARKKAVILFEKKIKERAK